MSKWRYNRIIVSLIVIAGIIIAGWQVISLHSRPDTASILVPRVQAAEVTPTSPVISPSTPLQISMVWPQDGQGHSTDVAQSRAVNISVWYPQAMNCTMPEPWLSLYYLDSRLYIAKNNEPVELVNVKPAAISRTINGTTFPTIEFDNIPADLTQDPSSKYSFILSNEDSVDLSSVWVHAADARTIYPQAVTPTGVTEVSMQGPWELDSRIQVVWPHDAQGNYVPPDRATFVNVAVDLFKHGTLESVPANYPPDILGRFVRYPALLVAEDNAPAFVFGARDRYDIFGAKAPEKVTYTVNGQTFPRWVFNDVPVRPNQTYHFYVLVVNGGKPPAVKVYPSIWTHAADARTNLPEPQVFPCVP